MTQPDPLMFNPPPGWPKPPKGWMPPKGWKPDPGWPEPPPGWPLWIKDSEAEVRPNEVVPPPPNGHLELPTEGSNTAVELSADDRCIELLRSENAAMRARLQAFEGTVILDDERTLQEAGIYRYHHPLENALAYKERLDTLSTQIASMIKACLAIEVSSTFTLDGSLAKGRAMTGDLSRLMLRAYNAEAENVVRSMRFGAATTATHRLDSARSAIARLGKLMEMRISDGFHALRIKEIELTADYRAKQEEEREAARAERERLREERKVAMELAAAREKLEKERAHLMTVLEKVRASGASDPELENKLANVDLAITQNDYRAANIRAGYVYVISNRGAFGSHVVKIGLTRRLEPLDRINELGDASVPFRFDVHAIFFSEDAVSLEAELHGFFSNRRVNWANNRREFFFASPEEVREVLSAKVGNLLEFSEHVESTEYLQSVGYWPKSIPLPGPLRPSP